MAAVARTHRLDARPRRPASAARSPARSARRSASRCARWFVARRARARLSTPRCRAPRGARSRASARTRSARRTRRATACWRGRRRISRRTGPAAFAVRAARPPRRHVPGCGCTSRDLAAPRRALLAAAVRPALGRAAPTLEGDPVTMGRCASGPRACATSRRAHARSHARVARASDGRVRVAGGLAGARAPVASEAAERRGRAGALDWRHARAPRPASRWRHTRARIPRRPRPRARSACAPRSPRGARAARVRARHRAARAQGGARSSSAWSRARWRRSCARALARGPCPRSPIGRARRPNGDAACDVSIHLAGRARARGRHHGRGPARVPTEAGAAHAVEIPSRSTTARASPSARCFRTRSMRAAGPGQPDGDGAVYVVEGARREPARRGRGQRSRRS